MNQMQDKHTAYDVLFHFSALMHKSDFVVARSTGIDLQVTTFYQNKQKQKDVYTCVHTLMPQVKRVSLCVAVQHLPALTESDSVTGRSYWVLPFGRVFPLPRSGSVKPELSIE